MKDLKDLKWGVTVSAAQTEGAFNIEGRGPSIWDKFTAKNSKIKDGTNAQVATDFYHLFRIDIDLAKKIGLKIFRFSISWSRVLPSGEGVVNLKGIDFYHQVINYCLEVGIEPWITVYHWDLPLALEKKGGWTKRDIIKTFLEYVKLLKTQYAKKVKNWIVINEAIVCVGAGYFLGVHAPGKRGIYKFSAALHHMLLAQARATKILQKDSSLQVGTAISCTKIESYTNRNRDRSAAKRVDALMNRLCIEPYLGLGYPEKDLPLIKYFKGFIKPGDMEEMKTDFDFWGIQTYAREKVKAAWYIPYLRALQISARRRKIKPSVMGWETYAEGTGYFLKRFAKYNPEQPLWLSECGMALSVDEDDEKRIDYYKKVIKETEKIIQEDVNLKGILIWTLVDNFEWAEGFVPKFGLVSLDRKTLERKLKKSAYWLQDFLSNQESKSLIE